ncbi:MAG: hypothetical protein ACE5I9_10615 [Candidatus Methylomirabilales bacterium]
MAEVWEPIDLRRVKTYPLQGRPSKVSVQALARVWRKGASLQDFLGTLPDILGARDFRSVVRAIVAARRAGKPVILGMGAHVIKVGLSLVVVDLMERGIVSAIAMNGAGPIHDFELAFAGFTSEEVEAVLRTGEFGMAEETGSILNEAIREGMAKGWGFGRAVGEKLLALNPPYLDLSLCAAAVRLHLPVTVHVAVGTDVIHMHPSCDGAAIGQASHLDFRLLTAAVAQMEGGGVYLNVGSAVLLPEVFMKAVAVARNLGHGVTDFTTVNMDFLQHYRPTQNVVHRPVAGGGQGYALTGHHEILFPLLAAAVIEEWEEPGAGSAD